MTDPPLFCDRCARELTPGTGGFYVVRIDAVADPTPPSVTAEDVAGRDFAREIERLLAEMQDLSEQELMDQVCRRLMLYLCGACFREWIENPVG